MLMKQKAALHDSQQVSAVRHRQLRFVRMLKVLNIVFASDVFHLDKFQETLLMLH